MIHTTMTERQVDVLIDYLDGMIDFYDNDDGVELYQNWLNQLLSDTKQDHKENI